MLIQASVSDSTKLHKFQVIEKNYFRLHENMQTSSERITHTGKINCLVCKVDGTNSREEFSCSKQLKWFLVKTNHLV